MKVNLAYGEGQLPVDLPDNRTTVILPGDEPGLPDERAAVMNALAEPIGAPPLKEIIRSSDRVCIVFTDITRATPNHRLIPWLLEYLSGVPKKNILLLNGLGTHRPNTRAELEKMLTPAVVHNYRVINHESYNPKALVELGATRNGTPILINRHLVEAHVRIITGFIEPHFFAGFSGGPKGIMPGVAGLQTILNNHGVKLIGHAKATFGVTTGNPLWEQMRDIAIRVGTSFLLNVALNTQRQITGVFAGDLSAAHKVGTRFVKQSAMQKVEAPFDIVVTTNSGYPLDLNLYQGVKGMSAGARIVKKGGVLILAAECREGVPASSPYEKLLHTAHNPEEILSLLASPGCFYPEQWQAQIQALIQRKATVYVHSSLPDETIRAAHLIPCHDIGAEVNRQLDQLGPDARVAVLPQGPLTVPYVG